LKRPDLKFRPGLQLRVVNRQCGYGAVLVSPEAAPGLVLLGEPLFVPIEPLPAEPAELSGFAAVPAGLVALPGAPLMGPEGEVTPPVLLPIVPELELPLEPISADEPPMLLGAPGAEAPGLPADPPPALCAKAAGAKAATERASPAPSK
jgi:hypothetical protein